MRLLMPLAFAVSVGMCVIGWLDDKRLAPAQSAVPAARPETTESWSIHLGIAALVAAVMLLAEAASLTLHITLVAAVTLAVPAVALTWSVVQAKRFIRRNPLPRASAVIARRCGGFFHRVPHFRGEATVLAGSGFMGAAAGGALHATGLAPLLAHVPPIGVPMLVPVVLIMTGQLGLNPVAVVALLGAAMPDPRIFGVSPTVLAFACMLGWGLSVNMTPMSASAITTARWAGVSPWTVSTAWNALFTLSALLLSWAAIALLFMFP
jgi:hypothetical protein